MKHFSTINVAVACALVVASVALAKKVETKEGKAEVAPVAQPPSGNAPDMRYWNGEYRFEFLYSGDWYPSEQRAGSYSQRTLRIPNMPEIPSMPGMPSTSNMPSMPRMSSITMPRTVNVCFATKRNCESKNAETDPIAHFSIVNMQAVENMVSPGMRKQLEQAQARAAAKASAEEPAPEGAAPPPQCDTLEKTSVTWGGAKAMWMAMSCPSGEGRQLSAAVSMQRKAMRGEDMYSLMCTMGVKAKEKAAAEAAYRQELKPRCGKIVATTKFLP